MTTVNISALIPAIFAKSFKVLRKNVTMTNLVNFDYQDYATKQGETITIPKPVRGAVTDVLPGPVPPGGDVLTAEVVKLDIDKWKKRSFVMDENDARRIYDTSDYLPPQVGSAMADLAEMINATILGLYTKTFNFQSDAGFAGPHIDPFSSSNKHKAVIGARSLLNKNLTPSDERYFVMSQAAEDAALLNDIFVNNDYGGFEAMRTGKITQKLGFLWGMDQQMPSHTAGTAAAATDITVSANAAAGVKTVSMAKGASTATVVVGDIFQFASDTTSTYVVTAATTVTTGGVSISFEPALKAAVTSTTAVDFTPSHGIAGLAFHRDAFTAAFRPAKSNIVLSGGDQVTMVDPYTGIPIRLTFSKEHFQESWYFDVLFGVGAVRPELAVRVAGLA